MARILELEEMKGETLEALHRSMTTQWGERVADAMFGYTSGEVVLIEDMKQEEHWASGSLENGNCAICGTEIDRGSDEPLGEEGIEAPKFYICESCESELTDNFHDGE